MVILALDMSGPQTVAAVEADGKVTEAAGDPAAESRHRAPIPAIDGLLRERGLKLADVEMMAFGAGPGLFSGLRVACATAQAICRIKGCRIRPVSTLLAIAHQCKGRKVIAALPAHREHFYLAMYSDVEGLLSAEAEATLYHSGNLPRLGDSGWTTAGEGFRDPGGALATHFAKYAKDRSPVRYPSGAAIIEVAKDYYPKGAALDPLKVTPIYARPKVAETVDEREARRGRGNGRGNGRG